MGTILIVANQTLGGPELDRAVHDRIERGATDFHVLVPITAPQSETREWKRGFEVGTSDVLTRLGGVALVEEDASSDRAAREMEQRAREDESRFDEARARAEQRLEQMLERVRSAGGQADGEVGDADPAVGVQRLLEGRSFDEIIISTLPARFSRWLKMDVTSRVSRMTDAPVTTVEAEAGELTS